MTIGARCPDVASLDEGRPCRSEPRHPTLKLFGGRSLDSLWDLPRISLAADGGGTELFGDDGGGVPKRRFVDVERGEFNSTLRSIRQLDELLDMRPTQLLARVEDCESH